MTSTLRLRSALVIGLVLFVAPVLSPRAGTAATWIWPSFDCFQTLQNCIDFAMPGDVVEVASHGPIAESLTIQGKSLTLRPYAGFVPVFSGPNTIFVSGGNDTVVVTVQGMTLQEGRLILRQTGSGSFGVLVLDNTFLDSLPNGYAIEIGSNNSLPTYGKVAFEVSGNRIAVSESSSGITGAVQVGVFFSSARGRIVGNTVQLSGVPSWIGAIQIDSGAAPLAVDVLHNEIRGNGFNSGISLRQGSIGNVSARVINNLVVGQVSHQGMAAGISLYSSQGTMSAQVVNNTVVGGDTGVLAGARTDVGASLSGVLANNLVVGHRQVGFNVGTEIQATFVNERNLSFRNVLDYFVPGPGTLFVDPLFLTPNDFRLGVRSPAKDAGSNARVPKDITLDLGRLPRIQGVAVAMGAYEETVPR